jgi:predicted secreted protein
MPKYVLAIGALCFFSLIGYHLVFSKGTTHVLIFPIRTNAEHEQARLHPGDNFTVNLPHNPSTPFAWHVKNTNTDVILQTNEEFTQNELLNHDGDPRQMIVGVPGVRTWSFSARTTGNATITFKLRNVGEPSYTTQTYRLDLSVE